MYPVEVWRTDALMALVEQHGIDLGPLIHQMIKLGSGKLPLGESGYWIEFWLNEQGSSADGLYLSHSIASQSGTKEHA